MRSDFFLNKSSRAHLSQHSLANDTSPWHAHVSVLLFIVCALNPRVHVMGGRADRHAKQMTKASGQPPPRRRGSLTLGAAVTATGPAATRMATGAQTIGGLDAEAWVIGCEG